MTFDDDLRQLSAGRKARRLQNLIPAIEQKLAEGVTHHEILGLLNANGFELSERTYKSYLYRYRKRRRNSRPGPIPVQWIEQPKFPLADAAPSPAPTPAAPGQGPNTFEFNAGGLPAHLLK
jgi:hypothetical protein